MLNILVQPNHLIHSQSLSIEFFGVQAFCIFYVTPLASGGSSVMLYAIASGNLRDESNESQIGYRTNFASLLFICMCNKE